MINETTIEDEDLLSAWAIHFSLAACTASVLREKLKNPSNIHFCESIPFDESMQFDFIYFLTQMFLSGDIETLGRIILEPEGIHELVQQTASLRKSLNESGDFNEANYRTKIDRIPFIRCNFLEQTCVSFELLVTDLFDPDHKLRGLLRDLQASFNTTNENRGIEVRDSSCVTSHNVTKCTKDKGTQTPSSQRSKQTQTKGTRYSSSKSQTNSTEKNPPKITPKIPRKRRINSSGRKSLHGKIPKVGRIENYFKPIPKEIQTKRCDIQTNKANRRSSSNKVEIYTVEDDSDSSIELMGNALHRDHVGIERDHSVIEELNSFEIECFQEDRNSLRMPITTPIEASDTDICVPKENLPDCHATQVTQLFALKAKNVAKKYTFGSQDNCIETCDTETAANRDISNSANNTDLHCYDKKVFQLDATARETIREWCGGDTFLTKESSGSSGEGTDNGVSEYHSWNNNYDKFNDDDDNDVDDNGVMNGDLDHYGHDKMNDKSDTDNENDDDEDNNDDNDDDDIVMNGDLDHNGHDENNVKSDTDNESDDDSDDDDDDDDDIESDNVNDEDYVYDSEDESSSESDEDYNKN